MVASDVCLGFYDAREEIAKRLKRAASGCVQLLSGPRQAGKTTLLLELSKRHPASSIYAAAYGPEAALPGFWENVWKQAEDVAAKKGRATVIVDEVHLLPDWATRLKSASDRLRRHKLPVCIIAAGSSTLRTVTGSREGVTGRFERITLSHWSASSLGKAFGVSAEEASEILVKTGTYPGAFELRNDFPRLSSYVRDAIVEPAVGRDIPAQAEVRRPALLRQLFAVCASFPAQIVSLQKLQSQLTETAAIQTIANYITLLEGAYLVAALPKHATRAARQRAAPPKLITLDNALLAVMDPNGIPTRATDPKRVGAWVENACLGYAWSAGQRVTYWREEPLHVDAVIDGSWGAWAVQIKTGALSSAALNGLTEFVKRYPKYRPLVVCDEMSIATVDRTGIPSMTWQNFLQKGLNPRKGPRP